MKSQMTIGKKLMLGFGVTLALVFALAYSSLSSIGSLGKELDLTAVGGHKMFLMGQMDAAVSDMRVGQRGVVMYSMMKDPARVETANQMHLNSEASILKMVAELKPLLQTDRGKRAVETLVTSLEAWRPHYKEVRDLCAKEQFNEELKRAIDQGVAQSVQMSQATDDVIQAQNELFTASVEKAKAQTARSRWIAFALIGLCLAVGAVVVFIVQRISSSLRQIAAEMADGADQVSSAAGQVSSSSQSLAQGASEQAASIEETSASSEEINSMSRKNTENSKVAAQNMEDASARIADANRNLEQMVESMNEINASSDKISKIIKVIDEIAFQTNILALNAAVEAARAGEAGMGFAVVADEVRNLAQRCAQAAKDTAGLIEESIAKSKDGKSKLDQVAAAVNSITESAGKVKTLVDEVKVGSEEQTRGIEQVTKAITQMEKVTQTTAANAEESASASEELSAQSDTLRSVVARLNGMVGGGGAGNDVHRTHGHVPSAGRGPGGAGLGSRKAAAPKRAMDAHSAGEPVGAHAGDHEISLQDDFKEF